jgi:ribosomal protein L34
MKKKIRNSNTKRRRMTGFRYRNSTSGGKQVIKRRRKRHRSF